MVSETEDFTIVYIIGHSFGFKSDEESIDLTCDRFASTALGT